jgi:hypothetical protein
MEQANAEAGDEEDDGTKKDGDSVELDTIKQTVDDIDASIMGEA